jgi:hypothetical protein
MSETTSSEENTRLSNNVSVRNYRDFVQDWDKAKIADLIRSRFIERYITPIEETPRHKKHGFCTMAISCLMIEALESFRVGLGNSSGCSKTVFRSFFQRHHHEFEGIQADTFYDHVRCGILHQAETTGGWKIERKGPIFDSSSLTLNATEFHRVLRDILNRYCSELEKADWESQVWVLCRQKMEAVISNCAKVSDEKTQPIRSPACNARITEG